MVSVKSPTGQLKTFEAQNLCHCCVGVSVMYDAKSVPNSEIPDLLRGSVGLIRWGNKSLGGRWRLGEEVFLPIVLLSVWLEMFDTFEPLLQPRLLVRKLRCYMLSTLSTEPIQP